MPSQTKRKKNVALHFTHQVGLALERLRATSVRLLAAVSGGPDSTALLVALAALRRKKQINLAAIHANHALRGPGSDADEQFVCDLCQKHRIELIRRRLPVPLDAADRQEGIELTARMLRLQFFSEIATQQSFRFVATAHTADDQAETVLHRIVRGTSLAGLAGIPAARDLVSGVVLVRPLLELDRAEVLDYLSAMRQSYREDQSNTDLSFTRNRLRHAVIPYLIEHFNPRLRETLTRLARNAADAQVAIDAQVRRLRRRTAANYTARRIRLRIAPVRNAPPFLVRELVRKLWADAGWPLRELGQAELDRICDVALDRAKSWDLPHGVRATQTRGQLLLVRMPPMR